MKKFLALMLCLMLCLPAAALAEAPALLYPVDFGTFTMNLSATDQYQVGDTMTSNELYAMIYTDYDPYETTHDSINVVWSQDNFTLEIALMGGIQKYAEAVLEGAESQYSAMGIKMTNAVVLDAGFGDNRGYTVTSCMMDYTNAGINLVTPLYQMQLLFCNVHGGNYIFTLTSSTYEGLDVLTAYIDTLQFK